APVGGEAVLLGLGVLASMWAARIRRLRRELERSGKMRADSGCLLGGRDDPLVQCAADAMALRRIFDYDKTNEIVAGCETRLQGILVREHAVKDVSHVVVFVELADCQHASGPGFRLSASGFREICSRAAPLRFAQVRGTDQWVRRHPIWNAHYFFRQCEN